MKHIINHNTIMQVLFNCMQNFLEEIFMVLQILQRKIATIWSIR